MKISVLTVCYNSAATIRRTLDSFFAQDWPDKEIVVVDGASRDDTAAIARSYPQERMVLLSEPDRGMYDALNKALRLYTGDAFGVLNSDDAFHDPHVLSAIGGALETADIVHGDLQFFDTAGRVTRRWRAEDRPAGGFRTGWMPAHPTFYVRRKVAEAVGPFDLAWPTASDYDWMLRSIENNDFEIARLDRVLVKMAVGGRSTASLTAHLVHNLQALRSRQKWLGAGIVDYALFAKPARKLGQFIGYGLSKKDTIPA